MTASLRDLVMTESEIAEYFGKGASTVRRMAQLNKLPPYHKAGGVGSHKLFLRPVVDAWARSDFASTAKIEIDLRPYPAMLDAELLGDVLRMERSSVNVTWCKFPDRLPPRCRGGKLWATQDLVMWLAQGAGVADIIAIHSQPAVVLPALLASNSGLAAITEHLMLAQMPHRQKSIGRDR